jgi:hypothetical protein
VFAQQRRRLRPGGGAEPCKHGWNPQALPRVLLSRTADHAINHIGELALWNLQPDII